MSDTSELKSRVESAIERLTASHAQRRQSNHTLSEALASLESKYNTRGTELEECRDRIRELGESNERLTALLQRIVEVIEEHANDEGDAAIRRARDMAGDIVRSWGGDPSDDAPAAQAAPTSSARASVKPMATVTGPVMQFEDVSEEELAAELLAESTEGSGDAATEFDVELLAETAELDEIVDGDRTIAREDVDASGYAAAKAASPHGEMDLGENTPQFDEVEIVETAERHDSIEEIEFEAATAEEGEHVEIDIPPPAAQHEPARSEAAAGRTRGSSTPARDDIRAMLERLERAASRAQAFAEEQAANGPGHPQRPRGKQQSG